MDATRAERAFLYTAVDTAIQAGAGRITLCDTAGIMLPDEFGAFVADVRANVPAAAQVELYVQASDHMSMGLACAAAAVAQGAVGVKCTAVPAGYPSLRQVSRFIQMKGADLDIASGIRTTELDRTVGQLERLLAPQEEARSSVTG